MKNTILTLLVLVFVTSCNYEHRPIYNRFDADNVTKAHSVSFQKGWEDGCYTGEAVYGNSFTKAFRDFKRDPNMVGNREYESAWYDAYHFCRQSHNTNINNWDNDWWGLLTLQ